MQSIKNCIKGWFVGNFPNAVFKDDRVEVALKRYVKGDFEQLHYHTQCTEVTVIVSGKVRMNDKIYSEDDVIVIKPYESTDFHCLTDVVTVVYKNKSSIMDKFPGKYIKMNSIDDVATFLDPHTFFSHMSEEKDKVIVYVSHMDSEVLQVINRVPDKVEGKHILCHFEASLDDKHSPKYESMFKATNPVDDFVPEDVPLYGLEESLKDLIPLTDDDIIDPVGDKVFDRWVSQSEEKFADFPANSTVTTYVSNK